MIDKALGLSNPDPVETYSNSPHLYAELDIPTDVTGLRRQRRKGHRSSAPRGGRPREKSRTRAQQHRDAPSHPRRQVRTGHAATNGDTDGSATAASDFRRAQRR